MANPALMNIHVVDVFDENLYHRWREIYKPSAYDCVIKIGGMCNGLEQVIALISQAAPVGGLFNLVFYGHGAPGIMNVSAGKMSGTAELSSISLKVLHATRMKERIAILRPYFRADGAVTLMGCNTGAKVEGRALISELARIWGVQVHAATWYQLLGRPYLVGNVVVAYPDGTVREDRDQGLNGLRRLWDDSPQEFLVAVLAKIFGSP